MNVFLKSLRAPFLSGSLIPVLIGGAYAFGKGPFSLPLFLVTALGVAALHTAANLLNDYVDARGSDPVNVRVTPFSGGSRVIPDGGMAPGSVLALALFFFALGVATGLWLTFQGRLWVPVIGLTGLAIGWAYSAPPLHLMSRGWGEPLIFFAFGPLVTLGTAYVLSGTLEAEAFALGVPQGFFIMGVIWINEFPDYEADRQTGKRNLVVRLGLRMSRWLYCVIMLAGFLSVLFMAGKGLVPPLSMLSVLAFPPACKAMLIAVRAYASHVEIVPAQALTIQTLLLHGLLLSLGVFLGTYI